MLAHQPSKRRPHLTIAIARPTHSRTVLRRGLAITTALRITTTPLPVTSIHAGQLRR